MRMKRTTPEAKLNERCFRYDRLPSWVQKFQR